MSIKLKKMFALCLLFFATVLLDVATKEWAEKRFLIEADALDIRTYRSSSQRVFALGISSEDKSFTEEPPKNWLDFELTYVRNSGAAWGSFASMPDKYRMPFFAIVTLVASGFIFFLILKSQSNDILLRYGLVVIFAGAMGNFFDRLRDSYVTDLFHFSWNVWGWEYSFPVFNFADIAINVGVAFVLIDSLRKGKGVSEKHTFT